MSDRPTHGAKGPHAPSRRGVLVAGAAGLGVLGTGGVAWVGTRDPRQLIVALLKSALPGVTLDPASLQVFATDYMEEFFGRFTAHGATAERLLSTAKVKAAEGVREVIGTRRFAEQDQLEAHSREIVRRALTRFLMNSNFFDLADPKSQPIVYRFLPSGTPCTNPFADLSPPPAATHGGLS